MIGNEVGNHALGGRLSDWGGCIAVWATALADAAAPRAWAHGPPGHYSDPNPPRPGMLKPGLDLTVSLPFVRRHGPGRSPGRLPGARIGGDRNARFCVMPTAERITQISKPHTFTQTPGPNTRGTQGVTSRPPTSHSCPDQLSLVGKPLPGPAAALVGTRCIPGVRRRGTRFRLTIKRTGRQRGVRSLSLRMGFWGSFT